MTEFRHCFITVSKFTHIHTVTPPWSSSDQTEEGSTRTQFFSHFFQDVFFENTSWKNIVLPGALGTPPWKLTIADIGLSQQPFLPHFSINKSNRVFSLLVEEDAEDDNDLQKNKTDWTHTVQSQMSWMSHWMAWWEVHRVQRQEVTKVQKVT